jgi:SAM-dependent methyltransferase
MVDSKQLECRACGTDLGKQALYTYVLCGVCKSVSYNSDLSAKDENNAYFQRYYEERGGTENEINRKAFQLFNKLHTLIFYRNTDLFNRLLLTINNIVNKSGLACEIGFGNGDELLRFCESGANIFGIDQSQNAVDNFKARHPQYSDRVFCDDKINRKVNVIYANALLEHVDNPKSYLEELCESLEQPGYLILRIPMIYPNSASDIRSFNCDINFWKPCHRILFSLDGLSMLMDKIGFKIIELKGLEYYGYKVMNEMLVRGYKEIMYLRNPYDIRLRIESMRLLIPILVTSLLKKTICSDVAIIALKS